MKKLPQREIARKCLTKHGMLRTTELQKQGVAATTINRMVNDGEVDRLNCGLYQLNDAEWDTYHSFAKVAKICRGKGVICLLSALEFHGLTDWMPDQTWVAIEKHSWKPNSSKEKISIVQYSEQMLNYSQEIHRIEGVDVKIFGVAKTVTDCFRHLGYVSHEFALQGLENSLKFQMTSRSELEVHAKKGRVWKIMEPYIDAAVNKIALYNFDFTEVSKQNWSNSLNYRL